METAIISSICYISQIGTMVCTQQTTNRDFTCSVREFTSSTGSIHVNSPDSVNKFGVSNVFTVKSRVFHLMTNTSETVPVLTQYDMCQTRSKLVTTGRTREYT